jgi:hypothetical protein
MNLVCRVFFGALIALLTNGCGSSVRTDKSVSPQAAAAAGTNQSHSVSLGSDLAGEITSVNLKGQFVVMRFAVGVMPAPGTSLAVYRDNIKVGQVKVTGPHRDTYTVADVLRGECQAGDRVREF